MTVSSATTTTAAVAAVAAGHVSTFWFVFAQETQGENGKKTQH